MAKWRHPDITTVTCTHCGLRCRADLHHLLWQCSTFDTGRMAIQPLQFTSYREALLTDPDMQLLFATYASWSGLIRGTDTPQHWSRTASVRVHTPTSECLSLETVNYLKSDDINAPFTAQRTCASPFLNKGVSFIHCYSFHSVTIICATEDTVLCELSSGWQVISMKLPPCFGFPENSFGSHKLCTA